MERRHCLEATRHAGFRRPLPRIHLASLRSLSNKTDELLLLCDFSNSAALCFTETWQNAAIPDSMLHLPNFQLIRLDHEAESTGKSLCGETCFYINERWCTDVNVLKKMCCSDLETLSSLNNLEINTLKTLEMTVDFRRNPPALPPLTIMNSTVNAVESFRFLGTTISQDLKWDDQIYSIVKKVQQRLYSLLQLRKFNLPQELLKQFYSSIIEFVLCTSITVWFSSATKI